MLTLFTDRANVLSTKQNDNTLLTYTSKVVSTKKNDLTYRPLLILLTGRPIISPMIDDDGLVLGWQRTAQLLTLFLLAGGDGVGRQRRDYYRGARGHCSNTGAVS